MDAGTLIPLLALFTLGAVVVTAFRSKRKTERDLKDPENPNSSLASDGPNHRKKD